MEFQGKVISFFEVYVNKATIPQSHPYVFFVNNTCMWRVIRAVSSIAGDVGVYLIILLFIHAVNYVSGDNSKFMMVMVVSGSVT